MTTAGPAASTGPMQTSHAEFEVLDLLRCNANPVTPDAFRIAESLVCEIKNGVQVAILGVS